MTPKTKQDILEEFDSAFDWAERIKEAELLYWHTMYGFQPRDIRNFLSSALDRIEQDTERRIKADYMDWVITQNYGESRPYLGATPFPDWLASANARDMSTWD